MIKLIANPDPVDDDFGDRSCGWFIGYDQDLLACLEADPAFQEDINHLVKVCEEAGYLVSPEAAYYAWQEYSSSLQAHWITVDNAYFDVMSRYLIPEKQ
jgi:hypothetical protein